ncbi:DUF2852 domain-containing protein [Paracraurococcus ruber]|uniref:DUF2852 domain-containing protein n=1 Tax=Paracraurococcus ruber TaxID=77675 RepID=A0ABS1D747_9PROT|nr:DUF2852 domain-containing protein [Paracraurococcus ruber]MBK1662711.1 hypothetical protein [Paracraurococcus ruber]
MARPLVPWMPSVLAVLATVGGFALWWPLGLLVLMLWRGLCRAGLVRQPPRPDAHPAAGDTACAALRRIKAERAALEAERRAFGDFLETLRRSRDREGPGRAMAEAGTARG